MSNKNYFSALYIHLCTHVSYKFLYISHVLYYILYCFNTFLIIYAYTVHLFNTLGSVDTTTDLYAHRPLQASLNTYYCIHILWKYLYT